MKSKRRSPCDCVIRSRRISFTGYGRVGDGLEEIEEETLNDGLFEIDCEGECERLEDGEVEIEELILSDGLLVPDWEEEGEDDRDSEGLLEIELEIEREIEEDGEGDGEFEPVAEGDEETELERESDGLLEIELERESEGEDEREDDTELEIEEERDVEGDTDADALLASVDLKVAIRTAIASVLIRVHVGFSEVAADWNLYARAPP